jgi:hypothetical protein
VRLDAVISKDYRETPIKESTAHLRDGTLAMPTTYNDSIIYVLCPAQIVTGGIEAVHQLVHKLRQFGHVAKIVSVPPVGNPVRLQYRNYDVAFCGEVIDSERNILIATEVNPHGLDPFHKIQKAIWWLSVDFHEALSEKFDFDQPQSKDVAHFVQSAYAASFLRRKGVSNFHYLTDYLHVNYLNSKNQLPKNDFVLYTPVKGAQTYIHRLMQADPSIQWLALSGMIRKMHAKTMQRGKVYVDFGSHPGKDRQPREAVVNGCCVIVGLAGAARFEEDVPIPDQYKFDLQTMEDHKILATIHSCLANHEQCIDDFDGYAEIVRHEEQRFEEEVKMIFGVKSHKKKSLDWIVLGNILLFAKQNPWFPVARGLINELLPLQISSLAKNLYRPISAKLSKR